ncbi:tRNA threonylcarbamoyladenosine dehydratase [Carboxylicivirga sp. A043]|uniref:tRNA threonylcarbamoyladenosine dehydratase n=1 Tax=Carboxylicivirga litoralis TaxID=2816963 RepID=UPI0021CB1999|nr:tRNA threonylcarbamoyladenosine dehydratase [Carboxylicivirga sp. A043]MCU4156813.1 tRNA threonylcarbamoyladenosine dehydratase [Carboxylicivirga sp. A043]
MGKGIFHRSELLLGKEVMQALATKKAILFGIGGVGSWCAESLVRTGMQNLTIVDSDRVDITNINRQLMATSKTVGAVKTEALKERLLEINPNANVIDIQQIYSRDTAEEFNLDDYDIIIDAIDSLSSKAHLIQNAVDKKAIFVSSMGAALKVDPTRVQVDSFWKVKGCPLARKVRKMLRKWKVEERDFPCVYSDEVLENEGAYLLDESSTTEETSNIAGPGNPDLVNHKWDTKKASINGSLSHVTGIFGFTLAGIIVKEIVENCASSN